MDAAGGLRVRAQQADVMASVQRLRHQAQAAGSLATNGQQRVAEENGTIAIEPASPQIVYVPVYNPAAVYGAWPDQGYQPVLIPFRRPTIRWTARSPVDWRSRPVR